MARITRRREMLLLSTRCCLLLGEVLRLVAFYLGDKSKIMFKFIRNWRIV